MESAPPLIASRIPPEDPSSNLPAASPNTCSSVLNDYLFDMV